MEQLDRHLELKIMLLDADDRADEFATMVETDPTALFDLADLLTDAHPEIRTGAIEYLASSACAVFTDEALSSLQKVLRGVADLVLSLLDDPSARVRSATARSVVFLTERLGDVYLREATPALIRLLMDSDATVQESGASSLRHQVLRTVENEPEYAIDILTRLATHDNPDVRRFAGLIPRNQSHKFTSIRTNIAEILQPLVADPNGRVREWVRDFMRALGW